jgi:hypothetical protein
MFKVRSPQAHVHLAVAAKLKEELIELGMEQERG